MFADLAEYWGEQSPTSKAIHVVFAVILIAGLVSRNNLNQDCYNGNLAACDYLEETSMREYR